MGYGEYNILICLGIRIEDSILNLIQIIPNTIIHYTPIMTWTHGPTTAPTITLRTLTNANTSRWAIAAPIPSNISEWDNPAAGSPSPTPDLTPPVILGHHYYHYRHSPYHHYHNHLEHNRSAPDLLLSHIPMTQWAAPISPISISNPTYIPHLNDTPTLIPK